MLVQFVTAKARETIDGYLRTWGRNLADRIHVVTYESLERSAPPLADCYVFSDLERLPPAALHAADRLWLRLAERIPGARLLNRPARVLPRFDLLAKLYADRVNSFAAYQIHERDRVRRYPVFVRYENRHWGAMTSLLSGPAELEHALCRAVLLGHDPRDLIIVEFEDVRSADGLLRKYSAFVVGSRVIPRDLVFSRNWVQKDIDVVTPATAAEERAFLLDNPYADALGSVAASASVEYGRIDFGVVDGGIRVWEINTNPILLQDPGVYRRESLPNQQLASSLIGAELAAVAGPPRGAPAPCASLGRAAVSPAVPRLRPPGRIVVRCRRSLRGTRTAETLLDGAVYLLRPWLVPRLDGRDSAAARSAPDQT